MSPNLRIAFRFLTAKKRAMTMSLTCTVLGVGLFVVTQATTSGYENLFKRTLLGSDGAMRVEDKEQDTLRSMETAHGSDFQIGQKEGVKLIEGVENPEAVMEAVRAFAAVNGASAIVRGDVQMTSSLTTRGAQVFGIKLDDQLRVSDLDRQITTPGGLTRFAEMPDGALVGRVLADWLQLDVGDSFVIRARDVSRRYHVAAIFETGYRDIDKVRVFLKLPEARSLLKRPFGATFVQISLVPAAVDRAPEIAAEMAGVLHHSVPSWQKRETQWLSAFAALRISSAITVSVFTLIASVAMFNTLAMIVLEKTKDIAILRSMGYERKDITQIFLWQAGIVLVIGAAAGAAFGAGVTYLLGQIPLHVTGIFKAETISVSWSGWHYVQAIATAAVMVMIASVFPARRAARLEPGDIVRGIAQ